MINTPLPEQNPVSLSAEKQKFNEARRFADKEFQKLLKIKVSPPEAASIVRRECTRAILKLNSATRLFTVYRIFLTAERELNAAKVTLQRQPKQNQINAAA